MFMRYGTQVQINVSATDADGETLSFQVTNLPSFATFTNNANGSGTISFNPAQISDQATYNNITVSVSDQNNGTAVETFNLIVNDNYNPVISPVANVTLLKNRLLRSTLSANDQNATDVCNGPLPGLPSFATASTGTGTAQLNLAPGYADAGTYRLLPKYRMATTVRILLHSSLTSQMRIRIRRSISILVMEVLQHQHHGIYISKVPAINDTLRNFKDDAGANSAIGLVVTSPWQVIGNGTNVLGATTGNNSGVYPDNVMRSAYYSNTAQADDPYLWSGH